MRRQELEVLELFAGEGGLSSAVKELESNCIVTLEEFDIRRCHDILCDTTYSASLARCESDVTWIHMAPPCSTFSSARNINDGAQQVKQLRSPTHPGGWGRCRS